MDITDRYIRHQTQQRLRQSKSARQYSVSNFPLRVASMAQDMAKLMASLRECEHYNQDVVDAVDYIEAKIRQEFVATFGHDMIALSHRGTGNC